MPIKGRIKIPFYAPTALEDLDAGPERKNPKLTINFPKNPERWVENVS